MLNETFSVIFKYCEYGHKKPKLQNEKNIAIFFNTFHCIPNKYPYSVDYACKVSSKSVMVEDTQTKRPNRNRIQDYIL